MTFFVGGVLPACHSYLRLLEFQLYVSLNKLQGCTLLCVVFFSLFYTMLLFKQRKKQQIYFVYVPLYLIHLFIFYRYNHTDKWSSDGCRMTSFSSGVTSCLCNHTTNFAVLMNYLESKVNTEM